MLGYWGAPEMTANSRLTINGDEWFVTGDTAYRDADGYLFYDGRNDDVINSAGYRIGPMEVENADGTSVCHEMCRCRQPP